MLIPTTMVDMVLDMASAMEGTMVDMVDMASATATMASVMLSPRLMLIPTTMVDMVLDMASAMEGTMVNMVDMASATATMASVMLSPRLMLIPTTMVDMVSDMASAMEGTMVDMVDMASDTATMASVMLSPSGGRHLGVASSSKAILVNIQTTSFPKYKKGNIPLIIIDNDRLPPLSTHSPLSAIVGGRGLYSHCLKK